MNDQAPELRRLTRRDLFNRNSPSARVALDLPPLPRSGQAGQGFSEEWYYDLPRFLGNVLGLGGALWIVGRPINTENVLLPYSRRLLVALPFLVGGSVIGEAIGSKIESIFGTKIGFRLPDKS